MKHTPEEAGFLVVFGFIVLLFVAGCLGAVLS